MAPRQVSKNTSVERSSSHSTASDLFTSYFFTQVWELSAEGNTTSKYTHSYIWRSLGRAGCQVQNIIWLLYRFPACISCELRTYVQSPLQGAESRNVRLTANCLGCGTRVSERLPLSVQFNQPGNEDSLFLERKRQDTYLGIAPLFRERTSSHLFVSGLKIRIRRGAGIAGTTYFLLSIFFRARAL